MEWIINQLRDHPELAIFLTLFAGFWLGRFKIGKFSLGTVTSVLLVGVLVGQLNISVDGPMKAVFFLLFFLAFFHGDAMAGIFSSDPDVVAAAADYLKAYAVDCMFTAIFFCYTGFYNGIGMTKFVMVQGIIGAFGVRVPVSYLMSIQPNPSLFHIGLATPMSSALQLVLCLGCMFYLKRRNKSPQVTF